MDFTKLSNATAYDPNRYVAEEFIEGDHTNVRIIRLAPGIALPPHTHGASDLMLYVVEGEAVLDTEQGPRDFVAGEIAYLSGDEELRVSNPNSPGVTLLAFLSPKFPPR